ncbi:MAG: hypothetical protein JO257_14860 [Deltaproteobacteria bacterium]|nr:hypothetical protein [Deltaproteobacteria bacterium]
MVRIRSGWLAAIVAVSLVGACKKNDNKAGTGSGATTTTTTTTTTAGGGATPVAVAGTDDLSLLPVDSEMVMGLNFAQLQQSALWKQFSPKLMEKAATGLAQFKAACGFDPLEAVKNVSMGLKGLGGTQPDGVIVVHGPEKAKVMACVDKAKAEAAKNGTELTVDGDVFVVKDKSGQPSAFTFVGDSTLIGTIGTMGTKDGVLAAAKGQSSLKSSQMFTEMYSKINTNDSLWILMNGNSPAFSKMGSMGVKPKAIFGSINVTDGLTVDMRMRLGTPDEAKQLVTMLQGQLNNPQVKQMFDKLDVTQDGADAKFGVAMSNQKLQQLVQMVGGMMGGMMGGGMGGPPGGP